MAKFATHMGDPHGADPHGFLARFSLQIQEWIDVLWTGLRVAMWIIHVGGKFCHGLLEKSLNILGSEKLLEKFTARICRGGQ